MLYNEIYANTQSSSYKFLLNFNVNFYLISKCELYTTIMKKILINDNIWQTRVAITDNGKLQNIYFTAHVENPLERSFFKGVVTKILPGIQTAFVDFGQERAGFLHISEIDRELAVHTIIEQTDEDESTSPITSKQNRNISDILKEKEPILIQVSKEPVYEKGAKLTTCFTLPGCFVVLMPNIPRIGVSKKIENREERQRLREIVKKELPEGMGAIIRTPCEGRSSKEISKDIKYLIQNWLTIQRKFDTAKPQEKLYEDIELPLQIVRDHLNDNVEMIVTDSPDMRKKVYEFIQSIAPEHSHKVTLYRGVLPLFTHFDIEKKIDYALIKKVPLKSGGSLIIESTEAMTVIDVNTGKFTGKKNLEETILKTNLEAAEEVVGQLRLRNIGGLIVIDFIDMAPIANRQKLSNFFEKTLREQDKFQSVVLQVSEFGIVQMTRKRSGKTLTQALTHQCRCCYGLGLVKSISTECYEILRVLKEMLRREKIKSDILLLVSSPMFDYLSATEYNSILQLEKITYNKIILRSQKDFLQGQYEIKIK